jgi:two-component system, OmpR family, response regulator
MWQNNVWFPPGRRTVLVVDGEPIVRGVVAMVLLQSGFAALTAQIPEEGQRLFEAHAGSLCLAVIDIGPQMRGFAWVQSLPSLTPRIPVLFITGLGDRQVEEMLCPEDPVLYKPFHARQLLGVIRKVLEQQWGRIPGAAG